MHKNLLIAVGISILFLGFAIQSSIATVQPKEIDVEFPSNIEEDCNCNLKFNNILEKYEELSFFIKSNNLNYIRPLCNRFANKALHYFELLEYYGTQAGNYPPDSPEFEYYYSLGMLCGMIFFVYHTIGAVILCWDTLPWYGEL